MLRYFVFFVFSSLVVFGVTIFFRLGGHKSVQIEKRELPAMSVIGKNHTGAYHKIGDVIVAVEKWAQENNVPCRRTFGEYFDDPREKAEDRLQSFGGCLLEVQISADMQKSLPAEFSYKNYPASSGVIAIFEGAPSIGPFKVYPAVENFMAEHRLKNIGSVIEIYQIMGARDARTEYLFKVE